MVELFGGGFGGWSEWKEADERSSKVWWKGAVSRGSLKPSSPAGGF